MRIIGLVLVYLTGGAALAQVIEPDDFAPGTDISTAVPGVVLSTVESDLGDPRVFAIVPREEDWVSTGLLAFGHAPEYEEHWVTDTVTPFRYGALRIDLDAPTSYFSIDVIANDLSDVGILWAYDGQGNLLAELETGPMTADQVVTLQVSGAGPIRSVVVGGKLADTVSLDRIVIPEPAAALVLIGGLGVGLVARYRRTRRA